LPHLNTTFNFNLISIVQLLLKISWNGWHLRWLLPCYRQKCFVFDPLESSSNLHILTFGLQFNFDLDLIVLRSIIKQGPRVHRFIVENEAELVILIVLFNGNLILVQRRHQFQKFLVAFNLKRTKSNRAIVPLIPSILHISLDSCWLLGSSG
jgi:hypothetical protein